jgi:hypothetical protein
VRQPPERPVRLGLLLGQDERDVEPVVTRELRRVLDHDTDPTRELEVLGEEGHAHGRAVQ